MDKSYRIKTNISSDTILNVNMKQDYDFLEVLTMKLRQKDAYRLHSSNYGVIIGRVLANDAFGIPNAKVSLFIERDSNDNETIESIYPYKEVMSKDNEGRRYNLLPDDSDDDCYRIVGTFPNKRLVLDNDSQLEIYDRYWKYTTVTNNAGDYMLFGVPSGSQQIHVDIDLSDIGVLSQKPRDFQYKGYNLSMFDSTSQFKESTNLDSLAQIFSQNKSSFVYPFWGDADNGIAAITRCDVQIQYKFEPTCVFMGAIVSDNDGNAIGHKCSSSVDNGMNSQLVGGAGTIEMIRKTTDGLIEEFQIQGNQLIDSDGVWCYQIPMNLDFVGTDECGNIVPTDNPSKGIPTRTQVRFRFSKTETGDEGSSHHTAKYLVPMNPIFADDEVVPTIKMSGKEFEEFYSFGSATPDSCFRDLYWDNVYSVKNYIPKVQTAKRPYSKNYNALKGSNLVDNQNSIPFNKIRVDMPFMYVIVCIIFDIIIVMVTIINGFLINTLNLVINILNSILNICLPFGIGCLFSWAEIPYIPCISLGGDLADDNVAYYPGCNSTGKDASECPAGMDGCIKSSNNPDLRDKVQQRLAEDYKIIKLDLYQDWVNGTLYMPLWHWLKRKKKSFFFGIFSRSAKNEFCDCNRTYSNLKAYVNCNIAYTDDSFGVNSGNLDFGEDSWHRDASRAGKVGYGRGVIKGVENKDGLTVYYYVAAQATNENDDPYLEMSERNGGFKAILLYATDIILLGNLKQDNIYGIPQLFKALPSTTANIPPIATIQEEVEEETKKRSNSEIDGGEETGLTVTTGMDWGHSGDEDAPIYKNGLFMDLGCTQAGTRSKSCINVERLSELGVNLDTSHNMQYSSNNTLRSGYLDSDGFITKYELEDMENRAMFATMNHIGFIPQTYQDSISGYTTQIEDERTHYLVPKFKYIYPVDFDGRMSPIMDAYKNGFQQSTYDVRDEAYITFRMGAEPEKSNEDKEYGRIRHFYHKNPYMMPLYNNSFYFYFGVNKGKTAIDKFNKLFYAECVKSTKLPFTLKVSSKAKSYCPSAYKDNNGYAYIRVDSDDIQTPLRYTLYDSLGGVFTSDTSDTSSFVISGTTLKNQIYTLAVTDNNDKTVRQRISLSMDNLSFNCEARKLGTKFYTTEMTPKSFICDKKNDYFGKITIDKVYIDGYEFELVSASAVSLSNTEIIIETECKYASSASPFNGNQTVYFRISPSENKTIDECFCQEAYGQPTFKFSNKAIELYVYQPMSYLIVITQECDGEEITDNQTSQLIKVDNGSNFNTYLNGMPIRFMLGTISDTPSASIANTSNFYRSKASNTVISGSGISPDIIGWFGVHQEDTYKFNSTSNENEKVWSDYFSFGSDITALKARTSILKYKFDKMFKLSNTVYVTSTSNQTFNYTYTGGVEPILTRSLAPYYSDTKKMERTNIYKDNGGVTMYKKAPNIVGSNYIGDIGTRRYDEHISPRFNGLWDSESDGTYLGNYFAAFTKNGRYTGTTGGKCSISIMAIPNNTAVNVVDGGENGWKKLGRDIQVNSFPIGVYETGNYDMACGGKTQPHLRALAVDRRLDYDLEIWSPTNGRNFRLHSNYLLERIWKSSRVRGTVYGGIEMSFDTDDNIISADTDSSPTVITPNNRLEYSYSADTNSESNAITIYNIPKYDKVVWVGRGDYISNSLNSFLTNAVNALGNSGMPSNEELKNRTDELYESVIEIYEKAYFNMEVDRVVTESGVTEEAAIELIESDDEWMASIEASATTSATTYAEKNALTQEEIDKIHDNFHTVVTEFGKISGNCSDCTEEQIASGNCIIDFIKTYYGDADSYLTNYLYGLESLLENIERYMPDDEKPCNKYVNICPQNTSGDIITVTSEITKEDWNDKQYLKTLYEANFNGADVRQLFWSTFNKPLLEEYCKSPFNNISADTNSVYLYSGSCIDNNCKYNGDFNRNNINGTPQANYPTRRYIDIGNLPQSSYYTLTLGSCSYSMTPQVNDGGEITSTVRNGETLELEFNFVDPFEFIDPAYAEYIESKRLPSNVSMRQNGRLNNGYTKFLTQTVDLSFKYRQLSFGNYTIMTSNPQLITVLNDNFGDEKTYGTDAITYLKTASNYMYGTKENFYDRLNDAYVSEEAKGYFNDWHPWLGYYKDTFLPENVFEIYFNDMRCRFYYKNNEGDEASPLTADDEEFYEIYFRRTNIPLNGSCVFALLANRILKPSDDKTLTKAIITHETSSLFDARNVYVKIESGSVVTETTTSTDDEGHEIQVNTYTISMEFSFYNMTTWWVADVSGFTGDTSVKRLEFKTMADYEGSKEEFEPQGYNYGELMPSGDSLITPNEFSNQVFVDSMQSNIIFLFIDPNGNEYLVNGENIEKEYDESEPHGTFENVRNVTFEFTADVPFNVGDVWRLIIYGKMFSKFTYGLYRSYDDWDDYNPIQVKRTSDTTFEIIDND